MKRGKCIMSRCNQPPMPDAAYCAECHQKTKERREESMKSNRAHSASRRLMLRTALRGKQG